MKFVLRLLLIALLAVVGYAAYIMSTTKRHSPFEHVYLKTDSLRIDINYCRPYQKGRVIFGYEASGAIQPYGKYWRMGANEATTIEISRDVKFGERTLPAGKYAMYAYPGETEFEVVLNKDYDRWAYFEPDKSLDVIRLKVPVEEREKSIEQLTISFTKFHRGARIDIDWGKTHFHIPMSY